MGKPQCSWWEASRGSVPGCRRCVKGGARAKMPQRTGIGRAGGDGDVAAPLWPAEPLVAWLWWQRGSFPLGGFPRRAHARAAARRPGRSGGAAVPSNSRTGAVGPANAGTEE
jgi:hypothetical protein